MRKLMQKTPEKYMSEWLDAERKMLNIDPELSIIKRH